MVLWFIVLEVELHDLASEFGRGSYLLHIIWTVNFGFNVIKFFFKDKGL